MKKTFIAALACSLFAVNAASAQNETYYGGQKGSYSVSLDADPLFNYVGNMFNASTENYLFDVGSGLSGRYFVSDQWAVGFGFSMDRFKNTLYIYDDVANPTVITDRDMEFSNYFHLGIGGEYIFRPGKRLQPFVGAYAIYGRINDGKAYKQIGFENEHDKQYASTMKASEPTNIFGFDAFIGVEYFFSQNFSVSVIAGGLTGYIYADKTVSKYKTDAEMPKEQLDQLNYNEKIGSTAVLNTDRMVSNVALNFYF